MTSRKVHKIWREREAYASCGACGALLPSKAQFCSCGAELLDDPKPACKVAFSLPRGGGCETCL